MNLGSISKIIQKVSEILDKVQKMEHEGYQFEAADASFELMVKICCRSKKRIFYFRKLPGC